MSARHIAARVCNERRNSDLRADDKDVLKAFDVALEALRKEALDAIQESATWRSRVGLANVQVTTLEAENARLREALIANTHCATCDGEKIITLECDDCLCGGSGRCKCSEEKPLDCPQCDGKGFDCTPETIEIVAAVRAALGVPRGAEAQALREICLSLGALVRRAGDSSALKGLTVVATAFSLVLQTYALPNAENPEGMCDSPDLFRRHFAEIVAVAATEAGALIAAEVDRR